MFEVSIVDSFSAAHNLRGYEGKCEALHGHNWKIEVIAGSDTLDSIGMVVDFKVLKTALKEILDRLDHRYLNEVVPFKENNPTSERLAEFIFKEMDAAFQDKPYRLLRVKVWETPTNCAVYYPAR